MALDAHVPHLGTVVRSASSDQRIGDHAGMNQACNGKDCVRKGGQQALYAEMQRVLCHSPVITECRLPDIVGMGVCIHSKKAYSMDR